MALRGILVSSAVRGCSRAAYSRLGAFSMSGRSIGLPTQFIATYGTHTIKVNKPGEPTVGDVDYGDVQALMERDHFVKLKKRLENDMRRRITLKEFQDICNEDGLSVDQANRLVQALSDTGFLLHFPNSSNKKLRETIFLRPSELNTTVHNLLEHYSPAALQLQADAVQGQIKDLKAQMEPMQQKRDELDRKAHRRANLIIGTGLGYCVLQFLAIGRLTWWELSWDVMEPVTYMLTFGTALIGYTYFVLTGTEYTYEGLKRTLRERKLSKLIKKTGFDEAHFKVMQGTVAAKEAEYHKLLEDIAHSGGTPKTEPKPTNTATSAPTSGPTPTPTSAPTPKPATA